MLYIIPRQEDMTRGNFQASMNSDFFLLLDGLSYPGWSEERLIHIFLNDIIPKRNR